ncbi:MAG TPA: SDR family oxidoreductase [Hyphomicrobiales bacterium]|nr:SDR family oxidoreductase [Hyphomicrobiales bacterium]
MSPRSILITGCSSGIGDYCARALSERGWRVFATARTDEDLARLEREGLEALYLDYREPESIKALAERVLKLSGGRLDALFNNGAYAQPGAVEDLSSALLREQFEANFFGWHDLTCRLVPAMRRHGHGRIVMCSSVLGLWALKYRGAYNAAKFAVEGLTDTLRLELRGSGIFVSTIQPGAIRSRFRENALNAFLTHIDRENSAHRVAYESQLARLEGRRQGRFKRGPEAVYAKLLHALESPRPRPHYRVTPATGIVSVALRILPRRTLDWAAERIS